MTPAAGLRNSLQQAAMPIVPGPVRASINQTVPHGQRQVDRPRPTCCSAFNSVHPASHRNRLTPPTFSPSGRPGRRGNYSVVHKRQGGSLLPMRNPHAPLQSPAPHSVRAQADNAPHHASPVHPTRIVQVNGESQKHRGPFLQPLSPERLDEIKCAPPPHPPPPPPPHGPPPPHQLSPVSVITLSSLPVPSFFPFHAFPLPHQPSIWPCRL